MGRRTCGEITIGPAFYRDIWCGAFGVESLRDSGGLCYGSEELGEFSILFENQIGLCWCFN